MCKQELRTREAHILQLSQRLSSMPCCSGGAPAAATSAAARPATAPRPPSPLPSASPLVDRSLISGLAARTAAGARALRPTGGLLSGRNVAGALASAALHDDPSSSVDTTTLSTTTVTTTQAQQHEEVAAQWRERERLLAAAIAARERGPLFEPSTAAAIAATATAVAAAVRPPSPEVVLRSYEARGPDTMPAAGSEATGLLRTSLVSQPLLQPTAQRASPAAPAADVWIRSPDPPASSSPQPYLHLHPQPVAGRSGSHHVTFAGATSYLANAAGGGEHDGDGDDSSSDSSAALQSAALEEAVAAAAERLRRSAAEAQHAERSRQVGEADFLRRRAGILQQRQEELQHLSGGHTPGAAAQGRPANGSVAAGGHVGLAGAAGSTSAPVDRVVILAGGTAPGPAEASAATTHRASRNVANPRVSSSAAQVGARPSTAAAEMDRSLDFAAQQLQVLGAQQQAYQRQLLLQPPPPLPPSQPEARAQQPQPQPRQQPQAPVSSSSAANVDVMGEGPPSELPALTAGIVSTLTNLRDAIRFGQPVSHDSSRAPGGVAASSAGQQEPLQSAAVAAASTGSLSSQGSDALAPAAEATLRELLTMAPDRGQPGAAGGSASSRRPPSAPSSQTHHFSWWPAAAGAGGGTSPGMSGESGDSRGAGDGAAVPSLHSVPASYRAASPAGSTSGRVATGSDGVGAASAFAGAASATHGARASGAWLRRSADGADALSSSMGSMSAGTAPAALGRSAGSASGAATALQQLRQLASGHARPQLPPLPQQQQDQHPLPRYLQDQGLSTQLLVEGGVDASVEAERLPDAGAAFPEQGHELYMLAGAHVAAAVVRRRLLGDTVEAEVSMALMAAGTGMAAQGGVGKIGYVSDDDEEDEALCLVDESTPSSTARSMTHDV